MITHSQRCKHTKRDGWGVEVQCAHAAKADGFCGIHHPKRLAENRAARSAKWEAKLKANDVARSVSETQAIVFRKLSALSSDTEIVAVVRAALRKIAALEASK